MINGRDYDWQDITVQAPHGVVVGINDINYSDSQAATARYGKGGVPLGYGRGNYEGSGSLTISIDEWERLKKQLGGSIYDHTPLDISVCYGNDGQPVIVDKLKSIKITKVSTSNSQGSETVGEKAIDFTVLKPIEYNGTPAKR